MIRISEVLPNPVGRDKGGEYIILVNEGEAAANLSGWILKDKSGKEFSLSGYRIEANEAMRFSDAVSGLTLNNSDEVIELLMPTGEVADSLSYGPAPAEGVAILHSAVLTEEIRAQLFDEDLVGSGQSAEAYLARGFYSVEWWTVFVLVGVILAALAMLIFRGLGDKK